MKRAPRHGERLEISAESPNVWSEGGCYDIENIEKTDDWGIVVELKALAGHAA